MHAITPSHLRDTADASPPVMRQRLGRAVTQWSVTKAEWIKLRSVRVNVVGIAAAAVALGAARRALLRAGSNGHGAGRDRDGLGVARLRGHQPQPADHRRACRTVRRQRVRKRAHPHHVRSRRAPDSRAASQGDRVRRRHRARDDARRLRSLLRRERGLQREPPEPLHRRPRCAQSRAVRRLLRRLRCADRDRRRLPRAQHCDGDRPPAGTADAGPVVGGPCAGHGR